MINFCVKVRLSECKGCLFSLPLERYIDDSGAFAFLEDGYQLVKLVLEIASSFDKKRQAMESGIKVK